MRAGTAIASGGRHVLSAIVQAFLIVAIIAALIFAVATVTMKGPGGADAVFAGRASSPWLMVGSGSAASRTAVTTDSHFTAHGCGFRPNGSDYYLVLHGPAPDTKSLAYWVDSFPVGGDGCGSASPSWTSSGVDGAFDVYVVRSSSGNPWQARPVSNTVEVEIVN